MFSDSCFPVLQIICCVVHVMMHQCSPSSAIPSFFRHIGPPFRAYQSWTVPRECGYAFNSQSPSFLLSPCLPQSHFKQAFPQFSIHLSSALYAFFSAEEFSCLLLQHFYLRPHMKSFYHSCDALFLLPADFRDKCL